MKKLLLALALLAITTIGFVVTTSPESRYRSCRFFECEQSAWFQKRFDPGVKLFVDSSDIFLLSQNYRPETMWQTFRLLLQLGVNSHRVKRHKSCAVVGSSGNLRESGFGKLIDSNEAVIRFNHAPVYKKYRKDVGSKTTYDLTYRYDRYKEMYKDNPTILARTSRIDHTNHPYAELLRNQLLGLKKVFNKRSKNKLEPLKDRIVLLHPEFMDYVNANWYRHSRKGRRPSTGWYGVIFALHVCDKVNVFGFGQNEHGGWSHYYRNDHTTLKHGPHKADWEDKMLRELAEQELIILHLPEEKPEEE